MASNEQPQQSFSMKMVTYGIKKKFPGVKHIPCEQCQKIITEDNSGVLILDCRDSSEYEVSHIDGSIVIDYESTEPWNNIDLTHKTVIVCYCSVGYRSSIVADKLKNYFQSQKGVNVLIYNLEGGLFQWTIEGRPLNGTHNDCVHPYSAFWGKLLPANLRHSNL